MKIPEDWKPYEFGKAVVFNPKVSFQRGEHYPFIEMDDVNPADKYVSGKEKRIYFSGSCSKFKNNDVLFARITPCLDNKKIATAVIGDHNSGFGSTEFIVLRERQGVTIQQYVHYLSKSEYIIQNAINSYVGASGRQRADAKFIKKVIVPLPTIPEQRRIASILSAYDDLIENNNQRIAILENMAEQIYKEWFVRMRFPGYENAEFKKGVPKGWEVTVFTDVIDVLSGGTPKTNKSEFWNGEIFWFAPTDIKNSFYVLKTEKKITESGLNHCNSKLFPENTIFITARGTVGNCVLTAVPMAMNQTNYAIICKSEYGLSQFYTYFLLLDLVDGFKKGANGAVFDTIIVATFERTKFILPDKRLLKEFSDIASPMFLQIKNLIQQNELLKQTRDMLLPRLISGKLRVKDLPVPE